MWVNHYVGIPFAWNGADHTGASCWGLVRLVQREVFGRDLPTLENQEARVSYDRSGAPASWIEANAHKPVPVADAAPGDLLHMWSMHNGKRIPLHVGVVAPEALVLHTQEGTGAIIEDLRDPRIRMRTIGAYRLV